MKAVATAGLWAPQKADVMVEQTVVWTVAVTAALLVAKLAD